MRDGIALLEKYYNGSLITALQSIYPDVPWQPNKVPKHHWESLLNQRKFLDDFSVKRNLQTKDEWHDMRVDDVVDSGGRALLSYYGNSLLQALQVVYPEYK